MACWLQLQCVCLNTCVIATAKVFSSMLTGMAQPVQRYKGYWLSTGSVILCDRVKIAACLCFALFVCVQVMLWDWLKANLPSYVTMLGMQSSSGAAAPTPTVATAASAFGHSAAAGLMPGLVGMPQVLGPGLHGMSAGTMAGAYLT
jgi:hypothetical protein